jgi:hypothetical protein
MIMMIQRSLAFVLCVLLAAPGCATTRGGSLPTAVQPGDRALLAEYVQKLRLGSAIRIDLAEGRVLHATLMKATSDAVVVQLRTRLPEPPLEIPLGEVLRITPETAGGGNIGKMIGIGVAAGAGAALAVFMIIVALIDD